MFRQLKRTALFTSFTLLAGTAAVATAQPGGGPNRPPVVNPNNPVLPIPNTAPPPLRKENRGAKKRGMVYVEGRWDWQNGKWSWVSGRWEKERPGKRWQAGKWEQRGDRYEWVADSWLDLPAYPTAAPPAPKPERPGKARRGFVYVEGHWDWQNGGWAWISGSWVKEQPGKRHRAGQWSQKGDRWEWQADGWDDMPMFPTSAPPPLKVENHGRDRRGSVWIDGRWDWKNGSWVWVAGRWEKHQSGKRWHRGEWAQKGDRWEWSGDVWEDAPQYPTAPPPAPQTENQGAPRRGYVWVAGNYDWKDGNYVWIAGHWERQKANQTWVNGSWSQQGGRYTWTAGHWQ